jgi:hypothetical protein
MIRSYLARSIFAFSLLAALGSAPAFAYAQLDLPTCSPDCPSGKTCVFVGNTSTTQCITASDQNYTVDAVVATAASRAHSGTLKDFVNNTVTPLGNMIIALLTAAAFLLFIFGMFKYFFVGGVKDPKARGDGRQFMLWSIIALAVLFSVWGLVHLLLDILPTP